MIKTTDMESIGNNKIKKFIWTVGLMSLCIIPSWSQSAPAEEENIPHLVTFGGQADRSWGDDDFCQIFFLKIPDESDRTRIYPGL